MFGTIRFIIGNSPQKKSASRIISATRPFQVRLYASR
jgi:hypothetical protein